MPIEMIRIDDRLIHGQIIIGWCPSIQPDRLILCNDEVAQSAWEREIYQDAASEYTTSICTIAETVELLNSGKVNNEKILLIIESPKAAVQLLDTGLEFKKVVVGGMHFQSGKRQITDFIYIDDEDLKYFQRLARQHVAIEGQDVPKCKPIDLTHKLGLC